MFCPNCGTQNPETAQTCSKCTFHLRSVAAPKFKGTMLMMNQPSASAPPAGAPPAGVTPVGPAAPVRPPSAPAQPLAVPNRLKGTMVGVAPMGGGGFGVVTGAPGPTGIPPLAGQLAGGGPVPLATPMMTPIPPAGSQGGGGTLSMEGGGFSPPVPQPGVNPLGGTLAADGGFNQRGAQGPYGGPNAFAGTAAMPVVTPAPHPLAGTAAMPAMSGGPSPPYGGYGAPAPPFQSAPPAPGPFDAPPLGGGGPAYDAFGTPPPNPFGGPPANQAGFGTPGLAPYRGSGGGGEVMGPLGGALPTASLGASGPARRIPLLAWLLPCGVSIGGSILCSLLALISPSFYALSSVFSLIGSVWYVLLTIQMFNEVKTVTQNQDIVWWRVIVPLYNLYWMWIVAPQEVAKAKQILGIQRPTRSILLYIFFWPIAMAADLNDMVR